MKAQFYQTTVADEEFGFTASFVTIPRRSFDMSVDDDVFVKVALERIGLTPLSKVRSGDLVRSVAEILRAGDDPSGLSDEDIANGKFPPLRLSDHSGHGYAQFGEYIATAPIIPFENSPLSAETLGGLISKASGVGVGAYVGFTVAGGTPLLFVAVPAGMIICGAAAGVAQALELGLRERVLNAIRTGPAR